MKLTKKQIQIIIDQTPDELRGTFCDVYPVLGYFSHVETNWGYKAGYTRDGVLVVTVFGQIQ